MSDDMLLSGGNHSDRYMIVLPVLIDDLHLSPEEFRLYVHLKRVANAPKDIQGKMQSFVEHCWMTQDAVDCAMAGLVEKNLITVGDCGISLLDIWPQTFKRYKASA